MTMRQRSPKLSFMVAASLCAWLSATQLHARAQAQAQPRRHPAAKPKTPVGHYEPAPPEPSPAGPKAGGDESAQPAAPETSAAGASGAAQASDNNGAANAANAAPAAAKDATPKEPAAPAVDPALQQDLAQVMDDLVQARARVAVLGKSLFKTRVRVKIDNRAAPDQIAVRVALWLDGAPIWTGDGAAVRSAERALFDGFAAPGPHSLTAEVEQHSREDEAYRYTLRESYRFMVLREKRTDLVLVLDDDSDMADDFKDDQEGEYDVRTRLKVRAVGLNEE
jgi:hypothetical protein